jgi:hypothetical protein
MFPAYNFWNRCKTISNPTIPATIFHSGQKEKKKKKTFAK